jgi:LPPG:FO 2-phospho-L-lactate transferase
MIVVLTGGTGGAKLVEGLAATVDPAVLTVVCNTGDDCVFHGLHISPDIDTITYTLAGLSDGEKGWGIAGDTFAALEQLRRRMLGVAAKVLPISDDRVETRVQTSRGEISFQEFFVKERAAPEVLSVRFQGAEKSRAAPGVLDAIAKAGAIIVCPSNPITSIGPILAVPEVRAALEGTAAPVVGVSPMAGNAAFSGPAHKLLQACGFEASSVGVTQLYADFLDTLCIAPQDRGIVGRIENLGVKAVCTDIRMTALADKKRLAAELLALAQK